MMKSVKDESQTGKRIKTAINIGQESYLLPGSG